MNRFAIVLAATLFAPLGAAAQAAAQTPSPVQQDASAQPDPEVEFAAVSGKVASLEEQYAETKNAVSSLQKLRFSGYMQGRYAYADGVNYDAGAPARDNFFIRRGRFKGVYDADVAQFVVQLDATPSGVSVKEGFAEIKLPYGLAVDVGLQLFPFGYEVGVRSSSDLDLLERSAASRNFLKGEYDLGASVKGAWGNWTMRAGVFNGNGIDAETRGLDNDQRKDFIGRVGFDYGMLTGGVSGWYGKTIAYVDDKNASGVVTTAYDNASFDRWRTGADLQLFLDLLPVGGTALKGEVIWGRTFIGNKAGGAGDRFDQLGLGWHGIVTQNLGQRFQAAVRWESWTPDVQDDEADPQAELALALHTYLGGNLKLTGAYYHPMDGFKSADGQVADEDTFVVQVQAKF